AESVWGVRRIYAKICQPARGKGGGARGAAVGVSDGPARDDSGHGVYGAVHERRDRGGQPFYAFAGRDDFHGGRDWHDAAVSDSVDESGMVEVCPEAWQVDGCV